MLQLHSEQMNEPCVLFRSTYLRLASNYLRLNFNPIFFLTAVSNYREERKLKLLINVHIKRQEI